MHTVESIECFCIDFSGALDVKGNFQAFAFLYLWNMPYDVEATFTIFRGHGDVVSLSTGALELPVFDFKLGREHVVDVEVAEGSIAIVFKQNQHFIATFATEWDGLLTCAEISTVVNDLDAWCLNRLACANWAEALGAEFNSSRRIHPLIARCWVWSIEWIGNFHFLAWLEADRTTCADGHHHGVPLPVGRAVFLLDGDPFREFNLELVIINRFSVNLYGQLFGRGGFKETRNVVGYTHQVDA